MPSPSYRQVHLDFHTSPLIRDVARDFDARAFAATMRKAKVGQVNVFAKCHHGMIYHETVQPARHPSLPPGRDLLKEQIDALHHEAILAPIYISVLNDEYAATQHPDWVARTPEGAPSAARWYPNGTAPPFSTHWKVLDMDSPYQDYLAAQTSEVLERFHPVDGIFFDMCWDQSSCSTWAIAAMQGKGLDPTNAEHRTRHAAEVMEAFMTRFAALVRGKAPEAMLFFNSRPKSRLPQDIRHINQVEIESLPSGGAGYLHFPRNMRYTRTLGKPCVAMTARFHKSWADFGGYKPEAALHYETALAIALGARSCVGDQLHPRGDLDNEAYVRLGRAFTRIAEREPWLIGARSLADIAVIATPQGDHAGDGAVRVLTQLNHQFDLLAPGTPLIGYSLVILPGTQPMDEATRAAVERHAAAGGAVIAAGIGGHGPDRRPLAGFGVEDQGESPFTTSYYRPEPRAITGLADADHVVYERSRRIVAKPGTTVLARQVDPYFERNWQHFSSHHQTPPDQLTSWAALTMAGKWAWIAHPLFTQVTLHGTESDTFLLAAVLNTLLPKPLLRLTAPRTAESSVMRLPDGRLVVHVLHFIPMRSAPDLDLIFDVIPLHDVDVALRVDGPVKSVRLVPEGIALPFSESDSVMRCTIPKVNGHAMIEVSLR